MVQKSLIVKIILLIGFLISALGNGVTQAQSDKASTPSQWDGKQSKWRGFDKYDFKIENREAYVVGPKHPAPGNPWVWRARFPNFHAEADSILLERGFHIARINTDGMLGSPNAMKLWDAFYQHITERGLAKQCCLEGVSRGGLFVYGFASRWPERVSCIYCDTPVCDLFSWPGGKGAGRGHEATWQRCLKEYGLTEATANEFQGSPIHRLESIATAKIPILHIVSLNDVIVPPTENTFVLQQRLSLLGHEMQVMTVDEGTDKSGGHHFTHPDPIRVVDFIEKHASLTRSDSKKWFTVRGATEMRGALDNCRIKFERQKQGRVVFMGGSITTMIGWRQMVCDYLTQKFPETKFDFIDAGISSTGSTPGAFRLVRDVFGKGEVDLLFEEAAVNDLHNMRSETERIRGMEGILRHARKINPNLDIVVMHFADVPHLKDYQNGVDPPVVSDHEKVAKHYSVPSINLAKEVADRIEAGQFTWKDDFRNCHPSPFGHRLYASTIRRMLNTAWAEPLGAESQTEPHAIPEPLDENSYDSAKTMPLTDFVNTKGFELVESCDPRANGVGGSVRKRFHNVPMMVGDQPGDEFKLKFKGRAVGIFVAAGPDSGTIEYSVDGKEWKTRDLFTKWSGRLHIPWVHILESELDPTGHEIRIRVGNQTNEKSKGHAVRIVNLLVNE